MRANQQNKPQGLHRHTFSAGLPVAFVSGFDRVYTFIIWKKMKIDGTMMKQCRTWKFPQCKSIGSMFKAFLPRNKVIMGQENVFQTLWRTLSDLLCQLLHFDENQKKMLQKVEVKESNNSKKHIWMQKKSRIKLVTSVLI